MTDVQLKEAILRIVGTYYGIDTYGILSVLVRDYEYDYMRCGVRFEEVLKNACSSYQITKVAGKYYLPSRYVVPIYLRGPLEIDSCHKCHFRGVDDDTCEKAHHPLSAYRYCCVLNPTVKISAAGNGTPDMCPRNILFNKINKSEQREDTEKEGDISQSDGIESTTDTSPEGSTGTGDENSYTLGSMNTFIPGVSKFYNDTIMHLLSLFDLKDESLEWKGSDMDEDDITVDEELIKKNEIKNPEPRKIPYPGLKEEKKLPTRSFKDDGFVDPSKYGPW